MQVSAAIQGVDPRATLGLPTGIAGELLQNFAPEPGGIAFLGKPPLPWVPEAYGGNFRARHYKDLTETGNRVRKVSGTRFANGQAQ